MKLVAGERGPVPQEALDYFRRKKLATELDLEEVWGEEHDLAFDVAGIVSDDMLTSIRAAVEAAIAEGQTFEEFRERIGDVVKALGWSGGKAAWRSRLVFDTNMRTARAAGQWARIQRNADDFPFLEYHLGPSAKHREQHVAWAGTRRRVGDPWWSTHMPPNGFGCKCHVIAMDEDEASDAGGETSVPEGQPDPGWDRNPGISRTG